MFYMIVSAVTALALTDQHENEKIKIFRLCFALQQVL